MGDTQWSSTSLTANRIMDAERYCSFCLYSLLDVAELERSVKRLQERASALEEEKRIANEEIVRLQRQTQETLR